LNKKGLA